MTSKRAARKMVLIIAATAALVLAVRVTHATINGWFDGALCIVMAFSFCGASP